MGSERPLPFKVRRERPARPKLGRLYSFPFSTDYSERRTVSESDRRRTPIRGRLVGGSLPKGGGVCGSRRTGFPPPGSFRPKGEVLSFSFYYTTNIFVVTRVDVFTDFTFTTFYGSLGDSEGM